MITDDACRDLRRCSWVLVRGSWVVSSWRRSCETSAPARQRPTRSSSPRCPWRHRWRHWHRRTATATEWVTSSQREPRSQWSTDKVQLRRPATQLLPLFKHTTQRLHSDDYTHSCCLLTDKTLTRPVTDSYILLYTLKKHKQTFTSSCYTEPLVKFPSLLLKNLQVKNYNA